MIVLDTYVVYEPVKPRPEQAVIEWLDKQLTDTLYLTATSLSELLVGIEMMPKGRRRQGVADDLNAMIERFFRPRILSSDRQAAMAYSPLIGRARATGVAVSVAATQIAAIAAVHGFALAPRDIALFAAMGARVINPWST